MEVEKKVIITPKQIVGVLARTSNRAESDPQTAIIHLLWQEFFRTDERIANRIDTDRIFGVYTAYESDHTGPYTLMVGREVSSARGLPEVLEAATIPAGTYLVFTAEGEMPAALMQAWTEIWAYFSTHPSHQRAFTTDFERHDQTDPSKVEIFIAVREAGRGDLTQPSTS